MKHLILHNNLITIVDDDVFEWASKYNWRCDYKGYAYRYPPRNGGKKTHKFLHREIMNAPKGISVDHINHNPLDNRKENLRFCTNQENMRNRLKNKTTKSGYKGVYLNKKRWQAGITIDKQFINLGVYETKEEAALAYNEAAQEHFGPFAKLNEVKL